MTEKTVLSLSGGMDSTTLLGLSVSRLNKEVEPVIFTYPSKHNSHEVAAATRVANYYGLVPTFVHLEEVFKNIDSNLLLSGGRIPEGHYEQENMKQTVVPGRNMIFASILAGIAWSRGVGIVAMAVHSGDHHVYPDCRPLFVDYMRRAIHQATGNMVTLVAPFLNRDKTSIIKQGLEIGVPYHLSRTCYQAQSVACGRCGACQERLEAFRNNGVEDPIVYESREILPKQ